MKMGRKVYLDNKPKEEALNELLDALEKCSFFEIESEEVSVADSLGRITYEPVYANISVPHYRASAMDGVAVISQKTFGASETSPVTLEIGTDGVIVDTGDPMPDAYDAVIMIEQINFLDANEKQFQIIAPAIPWQHVRAIGEDMVKKEMILPSGHEIRPYDLGALITANIRSLKVKAKPKVAIVPTGDEIVEPKNDLKPGEIIESNSSVMAGLLLGWYAVATIFPIIPDNYQQLKEAVKKASAENDIVIINAGSSAGRDDYTADVIEELGSVYTHGVAIKPGKPVVLGIVGGKPVIGIPGYPVSSALTFEVFVKPLIYKKIGMAMQQRDKVKVKLTKPLYSTLGQEEIIRIKIGKVGEELIAVPLERGAGIIMSLVRADGIIKIPRFSEGIAEGEEVEAEFFRLREDIEKAILICGSHDMALDVLNDLLRITYPGFSLSSSNVGSFGGIASMKRNETHAAGMHLLDTATGEYNISYIQKHFPNEDMLLINLVYRQQGMMVAKGNPFNIMTIEDLTKKNVKFLNRQKGAGTRILLDYLLEKKGIKNSEISGYSKEEYNHLAIAAAVAAGSADVGIGIKAAAQALDLDFIPLTEERYDICIRKEFLNDIRIVGMLEIINSQQFKERVQALGGYGTQKTGKIIWASFPVKEAKA